MRHPTPRAGVVAGVIALALMSAAACEDTETPVAPPPDPPPPPVDTTTPPPPPPDTTTTPTQGSSDVNFDAVSPTSSMVSWTSGDGMRRLVLVRESAAVDAAPSDGQRYAADSTFASGDEIGSGNYVVFDGDGSSVHIVGLTPEREYHISVFEYNGDSTDTKYLAAGSASNSQTTPAVPSIIGSWLWGTAGAQLSAVATFITDSTYMVVDDGVADDGGQPGMERGTFVWDDNNVGSGALTTSPITDTSGDWGLSPPGPKTMTIRGDTLTVTIEGDVSTAVRVGPSDTNELVGAWLLQDPANANRVLVLTILDDTNYMLGADDTPGPTGGPGLERGTYTWNSTTGAFTSTAVTDTNGALGLSPLISTGTATVSGDTLTYISAGGPIALIRIR